ncbi:MAG: Rne/Rng family ribonuclease, partial [Rhodospirillaceae bacterium]|nr:Rne/Rng family ribonuclease [Rhodospirillaceae bacterium]
MGDYASFLEPIEVAVSEELLINVCLREVRAALVENGLLRELFIERSGGRGLVGNIYKGRVVRVLPGLQAGFVNVGLERSAFLHASDIVRGLEEEHPGRDLRPDIAELVSEGDELLVQVLKDPLGSKGARLSTFITLPSRLLVYAPGGSGVSVSARIDDDEERERLRGLVESLVDDDERGGYIVRTAAHGASLGNFAADKRLLTQLWATVRDAAGNARVEELVYRDLPLATRLLRDLRDDSLERVRVDSASTRDRMKRFADRFIPEMSDIIELHDDDRPLFELCGIEDEIARALQRRAPLKSGGYLVIDQTEALTTIDVNSGGYVGRRDLEETSLHTNLEAAGAIARQLRLRNLGGIIIVDFIDLADEGHRLQLLEALAGHLKADRGKTQVMNVSPLGLVE